MELLIRVVDKPVEEGVDSVTQFARGDVIAVMPDGHAWSVRERTNPHWRILSIPDLLRAEADALLAPELDPDGLKLKTRRRRQSFDMSALPVRVKSSLLDASRSTAVVEVFAEESTSVRAAVRLRPAADARDGVRVR